MAAEGSSDATCRAFRVPGGRLVRLETDLPFETIVKIAEEHGLNFMFMLSTPELGTGSALMPLFKACCDVAGVEVPAKVTARTILEALETVPEDLPEEYEDNIPKEGAPTTG